MKICGWEYIVGIDEMINSPVMTYDGYVGVDAKIGIIVIFMLTGYKDQSTIW